MSKPYVVSADIYLLLQVWAQRYGFVLPNKQFFNKLRDEHSRYMRRMFSNFELVTEDEIASGLTELVAKNGLPTISLDRVYYKSELNFDIARLVDKDKKDRGLGHRPGTPKLKVQINNLRTSGVREVAIIDDVIFSGELLERIIAIFSKIGIKVPLVYAGVGIAGGINRVSNGGNCEVRCVRVFDKVIDEICERDFYPGVPYSGRLLTGGDNVGIPYLLPFGKPVSWASIPSEQAVDFSVFCLQQTVTLFAEIERCSGRPVLCQDLGRKVIGLPMNETSFTKALRKIL